MLINQLLCQSPGLLNLGRLPVRATFFTYGNEKTALAGAGTPDRGEFYTSLNGQWSFKYLESPALLSENLLCEDTAAWDKIANLPHNLYPGRNQRFFSCVYTQPPGYRQYHLLGRASPYQALLYLLTTKI